MKLCSFIAATRPGYNISRIHDLQESLFKKTKNNIGKVFVMEVPALAISSTDIRQRVKEKRPIDYLVPEGVSNYILKHGLYK